MLKNYDSRKSHATLIFLGLDESRKEGGLAWKIYQGTPYFAVDVTPKGSEEQQTAAKDVISAMEAKGLSFFQSRVHMSFSADEGNEIRIEISAFANIEKPRFMRRHVHSWTGTPVTHFAVLADTVP